MVALRTRRAAGLLAAAAIAAPLAAPSGAAAATCAPGATKGGDWMSYGADHANTRHQEHEKVISPADVSFIAPAWTFSTTTTGGSGDITGTPVVANGCVYVATSRGFVYAINADSGEQVWFAQVPYGGGANASVGLASVSVHRVARRVCAKRRKAKRRKGKARKRKAATSAKRKKKAKKRKARFRCRAKRRKAKRRGGKRKGAKRSEAIAAGKRSKAKRRRRARRRWGVPVRNGKVEVAYVALSRTQAQTSCPAGDPCVGPYLVAYERHTGARLWATPALDSQPGSDTYGSPVISDGVLLLGTSGGSAELGDEADRYAFQGSLSFIDAATGRVLRKTWTIHPPAQPEDDFAGAGIWSTPAIDAEDKVAFAGTANPFRPQAEHPHSNAVLKFDIDRRSPRFGEILGSYKGDIDEYLPVLSEVPCYDFPGNNPPFYPQGIGSCGDIDLDFGASANLFRAPDGRKLVGAGQKSGVYHVFEADTMKPVWKQVVGPPTPLGGIVGSTAYDGEAVYGPVTIPGYVWSIGADAGNHRWVGAIGDGVHWGPPVASANGVVYSVDLAGFLNAWDSRNGTPLLRRPLTVGGSGPASLSWGGVAVARNTVYAGVGLGSLDEGFVVAFRRGGPEDLAQPPGGGGGGDEGGGGESAPVGTAIVAGPGATSTGYATPAMVSQVGGPLSFINFDPVQHDVVSEQKAGDGTPLFKSKLSGLGEIAPVEGMDRVQSGQTYGFFCSIHPGMRGSLIVR